MTELLIGVPVLGRPQNAAPLVRNLADTTPKATVLFLVSPGDTEELLAVDALLAERVRGQVMSFKPGLGDYARKMNYGYRMAVDEGFDFFFTGADDLLFHAGWWENALAVHETTGACVIGTRDLGNPRTSAGIHSTHFLVHRDYLGCGTIDEDGKLFHEGYSHEFCDDEAVQTAKHRGCYAHSHQSIVEHLHPDWGKAEWDDTYAKAQRDRSLDAQLFAARRHMWRGGLRRPT